MTSPADLSDEELVRRLRLIGAAFMPDYSGALLLEAADRIDLGVVHPGRTLRSLPKECK